MKTPGAAMACIRRTSPAFDLTAPAPAVAATRMAGDVLSHGCDILVPLALFLQGVLTLSPILPVIGIRGMAIYFVVYLVTAFELVYNKTLPLSSLYLCGAVWLGSCVTALHWQSVKIAFLPIFFMGSILITSIADRNTINRFITILTYFLMAVLLLSWMGFFYAFLGGHGISSIHNPDGRENIFYLTTFSNDWVGNFIRPSGVFDEPGTLSFLVCAIAALRVIYQRRNSVSVALLLLGTVTFSLTHFGFLALFVFFMNKMNFGHKLSLLLAISIVMVLVYFFVLRPAADALLGWRLTLNAHTMPGTRSAQLVLALSNISMRSFLWGLDSTGITDVLAFKDKFGIMAENPLGPLVTSGIFVSFPYYYFMIRLFLTGIRHREQNIYLAVALLFLPRPYVTSYGYSVLAMLFLLSLDKGFLNRS